MLLMSRSFQPLRALSSNSQRRLIATLSNNPHIYVHSQSPSNHVLSYLPTSPPNPSYAIGTTASIPPTPDTLTENPGFLRIVQAVIRENATEDPDVIAQAQTYASQAGSSLGSGGMFFPQNHPSQRHQRKNRKHYGGGGGSGGDGAGGASAQGGMGGGGRGGWIHVSDQRNPPDFGRTAWPEDIFGSLEVDGEGKFVDGGQYQEAGTYRMITNDGILGLSSYLRGKVVEKLKELEAHDRR